MATKNIIRNKLRNLQYFTKNIVVELLSLLRDRQYDPLKEQREILKKLATDSTEHLNKRSLYSHLLGTYRILKKWKQSEEIYLAGLYHSIYGTYSYGKSLVNLEQRGIIKAAIGSDAEKLVYYYCLEDRKHFPSNFEQVNEFKMINYRDNKEIILTQTELSALITIRLADHLEQLPYTRDYRHQEFYLKAKPFLTQKAYADFLMAYRRKI
ncbi:MAG: DUF6817 domain-containing protein [Microcystis panniformis]